MRKTQFVPNLKAVGSRGRFYISLGLALALIAAFQERADLPAANASTLSLNFSSAVPGTILDASGQGTGFPARLSGTGTALPSNDTNLTLNTGSQNLTIAVPSSPPVDFNGGGFHLANTEALGVQLSSLGFTGSQNFSVSASFTFPSLSAADVNYNQFGVYVGSSGTVLTREGFVNVTGQNAYSTSDNSSSDSGTVFSAQTFNAGDSITATITRTAGVFTETVADTTPGNIFSAIVTPTSPSPAFLNAYSDLNVGVYATNGGEANSFNLPVTSFTAAVVPEPSSMVLLCVATAGLLVAGVRRHRSRQLELSV